MTGSRELLERARAWAAIDPDPVTHDQLLDLVAAGDEVGLADHVGRRLGFGTAGLRGPMGPGPNRVNRLMARQTAAGVARTLLDDVADAARRGVVVAHDARHTSSDMADDVVAVMVDHGLSVYAFAGPVPTPLAAVTLRHRDAAAAVVVTASHNPAGDNGLKLYWEDGAQIVSPLDARIAEAIQEVAAAMATAGAGAADDVLRPRPGTGIVADLGGAASGSAADEYVRAALDLVGPAPARPVPLAYTAMHGVGAELAERVLREAGHGPVITVAEQRRPDPEFPTVPFPNPEEPGALDRLLTLAERTGAVAALANDPDADRLAVAVPGRDGAWTILTGDQTGALLAHHLLGRAELGGDRLVATTVVSSRLVPRIATRAGARVTETLTGFKWLCRPALAHPEWTPVLAYEEALGYAVGPARDKDGITAALVVADLVSALAAAGRTVWDVLDDLAARFGAHVTRNGSVGLGGPGWEDRSRGPVDRLGDAPPTLLGGAAVVRTDRPAPDVLRLWTEDDTRVAVRPSGTEPRLKYYCEAVVAVTDDVATAEAVAGRRLDAVVADVTALVR